MLFRSPPLSPSAGANSSLTGSGGPLLWETKLGLAFLRGLTYRDGALVIAQAGYYYIYSKVQLGGVGCPQGLTGSLPITHGLYKRTARYPEELELLVSRRSPLRASKQPPGLVGQQFPGRSGPPGRRGGGGGARA